jgi:hypothetical protein
MLTDIFATRYVDRPLWATVGAPQKALLVQCYRLLAEQLMPPTKLGKTDEDATKRWDGLEKRVSMELGIEELSKRVYGFYDKANNWVGGTWPTYMTVKTWMLGDFKEGDADAFIKERLSFIELAFRDEHEGLVTLQKIVDHYSAKGGPVHASMLSYHRSQAEALATRTALYQANCIELNERFKRAKVPLHYHSGYIQITSDVLTEAQVVQPFWTLIADKKWENVGIDMAEAVDRRDTGGRDPALYAAKALESVIKIISGEKLWTRGVEKGAANYIDNLVVERQGARFIEVWEKDLLVAYFSKVRNELGHGPGGEPMPNLNEQQTNWAIECAMSWSKSLVERL